MANRERPARPGRDPTSARGPARPSVAGGQESLQFSAVNLALGGAGLVALILGYWLLANGSITWAPLLLVLGYVVLLPLALIS